MFVLMQLVGGAVALVVVALLYPDAARTADEVVVPHDTTGPTSRRTP
jgi:hypothetical protein